MVTSPMQEKYFMAYIDSYKHVYIVLKRVPVGAEMSESGKLIAVSPTHTDSSVFIRILCSVYGHTDTTRHYTKARFRPQAQDMLLVDLLAVSVRPTETFL